MMNKMVIYTIGHSNRSVEELSDILAQKRINTVVDVRAYPRSRRFSHFNDTALWTALKKAGIIYQWAGKQLGGMRRATEESAHLALPSTSMRAYADHMGSITFQRGIDQLLDLAGRANVALMCAERDPVACHRSLISDYLNWKGVKVMHIINHTTMIPHRFNPSARECDEGLIYDRFTTGSFF